MARAPWKWLDEMKDVFDPIQPMMFTFKLGLVMPYTITKDRRFLISRWLEWFGFFTAFLALIMYNAPKAKLIDGSIMDNPFMMLSFARASVMAMNTTINIIKTKTNHHKNRQIFKKIKEMERYFPLKNSDLRRIFWIILAQQCAIYISAGSIVFLHLKVKAGSFLYVLVDALCSITIIAVGVFNEVGFVNAVGLVGKFLDLVVKKVEALARGGDSEVTMWVGVDSRHNIMFNDLELVTMKRINKKPRAQLLNEVRLVYGKVCELKDLINTTYSVQVFASITTVFVETVFFAFVNIALLEFGGGSVYGILYIALWTTSQIAKLTTTAMVCHGVTAKAKRMGVAVHGLFATPVDRDTKDEALLFSAELLHRDPAISANGFFNVDNTLLYSMFGSIAMYLIILVQFRFQDNDSPLDSLTYFL